MRQCRVSIEGLWPVEFLGFLENARNPKYPNLQASVEKHAIRQLCMYIEKIQTWTYLRG